MARQPTHGPFSAASHTSGDDGGGEDDAGRGVGDTTVGAGVGGTLGVRVTPTAGHVECSHSHPAKAWVEPSLHMHSMYRGVPQHWLRCKLLEHAAEHMSLQVPPAPVPVPHGTVPNVAGVGTAGVDVAVGGDVVVGGDVIIVGVGVAGAEVGLTPTSSALSLKSAQLRKTSG